MAYATASDVRAEFKSLPSGASSVMTDARIDELVSQACEYIDGKVGKIYDTPITLAASPKAFAILKQITIFFVADRIKDILEIKDAPTDNLKQQVKGRTTSSTASKMLDEIVNKAVLLSDASYVNSHQGMASFNADTGVEAFFKRDTEQW